MSPRSLLWRGAGARSVSAATLGTLAGNVLGLALPFVVTAWFIAGSATDAYFYALGAILFLNITISVAVEAATTPYIVQLRASSGAAVSGFVRRTQVQGALMCAGVTAIGILVLVVGVLPRTSFDPAQRVVVRDTILLLAPLPTLVTVNAVLAGACYAYRRFGLPTASVALRTLFALLAGIILRDPLGTSAIALGLVVGEVVRLVVLSWFVRRTLEADNRGRPSGQVGRVVEPIAFWRTAGPQAAAMSIGGLSPMVDKTVAVAAGAGAVTTVELATRLVYTPVLLLLSGVGLVLGSRWASRITKGEWGPLALEYRKVQLAMAGLGTAIVVVAIPLAFFLRPLARDALGIPDATLLVWTFAAAAVGIPFALASQMSVRLLLAARRTRAMPALTICALVLNLALDLWFLRLWGVPGIGLASAGVNVFNACAYGLLAHRLLGRRRTDSVREPVEKAVPL